VNVGIVNANFKASASGSQYAYVGGFFGSIYSNPTIKNCFVTGTLTPSSKGATKAGGIYAHKESSAYPSVSYCYTKITSNG